MAMKTRFQTKRKEEVRYFRKIISSYCFFCLTVFYDIFSLENSFIKLLNLTKFNKNIPVILSFAVESLIIYHFFFPRTMNH